MLERYRCHNNCRSSYLFSGKQGIICGHFKLFNAFFSKYEKSTHT